MDARRAARIAATIGSIAAMILLARPTAADPPDASAMPEPAPDPAPARDAAAPARPPRPPRAVRSLDPRRHRDEDGALVADLEGGATAILSLDAGLQTEMSELFERYEVPWGALVAMEPSSGRILAYVSHSSAERDPGDLVRSASAPAASVFKIITAAALLDAGVSPSRRVCYHGGGSRLLAEHLDPDPRRDSLCGTLEEALGGSINAIFARLADDHLDAPTISRYASAFGWGEPPPADVSTSPSAIDVPTDRLELARTAAGFWHAHLSPLHGVLIAATIANDGRMPRASVVDSVIDAQGSVVWEHTPQVHREVIGRLTARALNRMMRSTVRRGTARRAFHDDRGIPFLPGIEIAGKTGTLTAERPFRGYTWWVGFAPADAPTIAVAALVINEPEWRIKASIAAREALRYWLVTRPRAQRRAD
jgi:cell division protein FtsI/penicillin-binding protein 2